jgi:glucose-6-phosphate isomerase
VIQKNYSITNTIQKKHFDKQKIKKISKKYKKHFDEIQNEIKSKNTLHVLNNDFRFNFKISELNKFKKFKTIAVIGMGGSILGLEAIYNFLEKKIKKKIYFFDDIEEQKILNFKKEIHISNTLFIIISKSGNTIETLSNSFSLNILKKNAKNVIIISEKQNNTLYSISKKLNLFYIEHKNFIGGRYSVLSEVGILPAYLMGINTKKLRSRILESLKGKQKNFLKESTIKLAGILNSKKYNNIVFLNYSSKLGKFLLWCQQLMAESLGKNNKGFMPIISNVPKDHHSLLQLYLDGPKDKLFYIFSYEEKSKKKIKSVKLNKNSNDILNNKSLSDIKIAQQNALIKAFKIKNIPFREFQIKKGEEEVIGELFAYFMFETILIGKLVAINPFNQPAVEQVKIFTNKYLN